jgi:hypothetical protein
VQRNSQSRRARPDVQRNARLIKKPTFSNPQHLGHTCGRRKLVGFSVGLFWLRGYWLSVYKPDFGVAGNFLSISVQI